MSPAMRCPRCTEQRLEAALTPQGVEIDRCPACQGVWLDRGEIFYFAKHPKPLILAIKQARQKATEGDLKSPRTGRPMLRLLVFDQVAVDACPDTDGLWLDRGDMKALIEKAEGNLQISLDPQAYPGGHPGDKRGPMSPAVLAAYAAGGRALPNLALRSVALLATLYALLIAILIACVELGALPVALAVLLGAGVAFAQFGLGPFLMDLSLRWLYNCRFVERSELPEHLTGFVQKLVAKHRMSFPRFGLIDDGAPNAFTYGHHPNNARIVLTRGILTLLSEPEIEAVVAHEIGHARHWDMLVMTIAQLVPLVAYYVYRTLIRMKTGSRDKSASTRLAIAIGAYLVYIVSEYIVLWISRTREYWADRFAGEACDDPNRLASALIKIGYGLAGDDRGKAQDARSAKEKEPQRSPMLDAVGAMGIFAPSAARALAIASVGGGSMGGRFDPDLLKGAMRWELWNPWARFYELSSTHPLVSSRLEQLGRQAAALGKEPLVVFDEPQPESYWDEFFVDLFMMFLPALLTLAALGAALATRSERALGLTLAALGVGMLGKTLFSHRGEAYPELTVAGLLKNVKVSAIRGVPCTVRGRIIGRGIPGLIWSEDFVMQDDTGILFLDYRQPLKILEFLFGLLRGSSLTDQSMVATGWYRRAPVPFLELRTLTVGGQTRRCYVRQAQIVLSWLLIAIGLLFALRGA